jgi:hypothetical protein
MTSPPFFLLSVYMFTYLFSIKYLYFFIISTHFPHFNLFVSIFLQSYVNSNLHGSTLYILIIHKARNSETFKIVHLLASVTFNSPYSHNIMYQFLKDVHFRLCSCFMHTIKSYNVLNYNNCLNDRSFPLIHLIHIISFKLGHVSIPKRRTFSPLFLLYAYDSSVL